MYATNNKTVVFRLSADFQKQCDEIKDLEQRQGDHFFLLKTRGLKGPGHSLSTLPLSILPTGYFMSTDHHLKDDRPEVV